jgi:hypothetical protein
MRLVENWRALRLLLELHLLVVMVWVSRMAVAVRSMKGAFRIQLDSTVVTSTLVELDSLLIILLELIQFDHWKLLL